MIFLFPVTPVVVAAAGKFSINSTPNQCGGVFIVLFNPFPSQTLSCLFLGLQSRYDRGYDRGGGGGYGGGSSRYDDRGCVAMC